MRTDLTEYTDNGFVVIEYAISTSEVEELRAETVAICRGLRGEFDGLVPAEPDEPDDVLVRRYLAVHQPHKLSPTVEKALLAPAVVDVLTGVIGPNVKAMQTMLFVKSEGKPGQAWHQDEHFIPTRDRSLTAAWIALDDATVENGCLWVIPGSHRRGVLYPDRYQDDSRFDCTTEAYDFPYADADAVPVEVPAGAAVVFNGYLLHRSLPNTGRHGLRRALANHYMSAESLLPWGSMPHGTHVAEHDYRDVVLVAGEDPYAFKGITDLAVPHVRPSGDGSCDH